MNSKLQKLYRSLVPMRIRASYRMAINLFKEHGAFRSFSSGRPVTADGQQLAYINYAAVSYLLSLDLRQRVVFEFGSGSSTKFWGRLAKRVVSVEGDRAWYKMVRLTLPENTTLHLAADDTPEAYIAPLINSAERFDIIFIDGWHRPACARTRLPFLKEGGIIIHDNTEWYQETRKILLSYDLLAVDFFGFIPSSAYTGVTSFYFDRRCSLKPSPMPKWMPGGFVDNHENRTLHDNFSPA